MNGNVVVNLNLARAARFHLRRATTADAHKRDRGDQGTQNAEGAGHIGLSFTGGTGGIDGKRPSSIRKSLRISRISSRIA